MKKLFALALALIMVLSLAACGGKTDEPAKDSTSDAAGETTVAQVGATTTAAQGTPTYAAPVTEAEEQIGGSGSVAAYEVPISGVPTDWKMAVGSYMFGGETSAADSYSLGYTAKFSGVSQSDFDALIAYFDSLPNSIKSGEVYSCDWGEVQASHNAGASEATITWFVI